jgi:hypothetical protein
LVFTCRTRLIQFELSIKLDQVPRSELDFVVLLHGMTKHDGKGIHLHAIIGCEIGPDDDMTIPHAHAAEGHWADRHNRAWAFRRQPQSFPRDYAIPDWIDLFFPGIYGSYVWVLHSISDPKSLQSRGHQRDQLMYQHAKLDRSAHDRSEKLEKKGLLSSICKPFGSSSKSTKSNRC